MLEGRSERGLTDGNNLCLPFLGILFWSFCFCFCFSSSATFCFCFSFVSHSPPPYSECEMCVWGGLLTLLQEQLLADLMDGVLAVLGGHQHAVQAVESVAQHHLQLHWETCREAEESRTQRICWFCCLYPNIIVTMQHHHRKRFCRVIVLSNNVKEKKKSFTSLTGKLKSRGRRNRWVQTCHSKLDSCPLPGEKGRTIKEVN